MIEFTAKIGMIISAFLVFSLSYHWSTTIGDNWGWKKTVGILLALVVLSVPFFVLAEFLVARGVPEYADPGSCKVSGCP